MFFMNSLDACVNEDCKIRKNPKRKSIWKDKYLTLKPHGLVDTEWVDYKM